MAKKAPQKEQASKEQDVTAPVDVKQTVESKKPDKKSITAKTEDFINFFKFVMMKGGGSTSENSTVDQPLFNTAVITVEEVEKKVKKGSVEEPTRFVIADCKTIQNDSICLADIHYEFKGFVSSKFSFPVDNLPTIADRLAAFSRKDEIEMIVEQKKIILRDLNSGISSWIVNQSKPEEYSDLVKKILDTDYHKTFEYKIVETNGVKYLVSDKFGIKSGFQVNASLLKQVFSHCSILKYYLIPVLLGKDDKGKYLLLSLDTDNGGFEKIFREKNEITFIGDEDKINAIYGLGFESICNIAGNANLSMTYASDKLMFIYTEISDSINVRLVLAPRVAEHMDKPEDEASPGEKPTINEEDLEESLENEDDEGPIEDGGEEDEEALDEVLNKE